MTEWSNNFHNIDPNDNLTNNMFPGSDFENACKHFSITNLNNTSINPIYNISLFNCTYGAIMQMN